MNTLLLGVLLISAMVFVLYAFIRARVRAQHVERIREVAHSGIIEISAKVFYVGLVGSVLGLLLGIGLLFSTSTVLDWGIVFSLIGGAFASHYLSNCLACEWTGVKMFELPKLKVAIVSFLLGLIAISLNALFHG